jgi:hypothetical protein
MLERYHEGVIVTSTCIAGEVIQHLTQQQKDKAARPARPGQLLPRAAGTRQYA